MASKSLTDSLRETLALFDDAGAPWTTPEVADRLDLGRRSTYERLERLVESDRLETKKVGANARVWWRPPRSAVGSETSGAGEQPPAPPSDEVRALVDAVEEYAIFQLDEDGRVTTWNPGAERIKGYEPGEIIGEHFSTFYTEDDVADGVPDANLAAAAAEGSTEDEGWRVRQDGSTFWANVTITAIRDDEGDLQGFAKVTRDMTERRQHEEELRQQRDFTRKILETAPAGVLILNQDGSFETANQRANELLELDGNDPHTVGVNDVYDDNGEILPPAERPYVRVFETGDSVRNAHLAVPTPDGDKRWLSTNVDPLTGDDSAVEQVLVTVEDITQLKEQADHLERQRDDIERELDEVFDRVDDAFFAVDDDWRFTYVNDAAADLVQLSAGELLGTSVWDALPGIAEGYPRTTAERVVETQESTEFEFFSEDLDSWFEVRLYPSESGLSVYFRDVTERKEREQKLELYETVFSEARDGIYVIDDEFRFTQVNEAYVEMTGYDREELLGTHCSLVIDDEVVQKAATELQDIFEGAEASATLEADIQKADGDTLRAESKFTGLVDEESGARKKVGIVRDVSDRVERERELQRRVRQQEVVTELGHRALETHDIDVLMDEAVTLVADVLGTDYGKVLDLDDAEDELLVRQGVGWAEGITGEATVSATENESQAAYTLGVDEPVVVEDLEADTRFSGPDLLVDHDVRSGISVVIGPWDDPWGILGTHDTDVSEFSEDDVHFVQAVANILATAIERHRQERALFQQRGQLEALNNLNEVVQEITDAVINQSTREEIETVVVEELADTASFSMAWVGEVDGSTQEVTSRAEAGVENYLDDVTVTVDPDDELSNGPTAQALITGEVQVVQEVPADPRHDPWRGHVEEYDFESSAAIPIAHEGTTYGVLNVYADRPFAFEDAERVVLTQLGEVVGHAIAAVERKRALMSDEVVELEFHTSDVFETLGIDGTVPGRITLDQTVPTGDETYLVYGTATDEARPTIDKIVERLPHWMSVSNIGQRGGVHRFELRLSEPPVLSAVASLGGYVDEAVLEDGDYHMTIHLPPSVDVRSMTDAVTDAYPTAELLAQRQFSRTDESAARLERLVHEDLTDRQRAAVETAHMAGFFEWPRVSDGEDIADSLGVSPPTFHQHLRKAEQKVFDTLLSASTGT